MFRHFNFQGLNLVLLFLMFLVIYILSNSYISRVIHLPTINQITYIDEKSDEWIFHSPLGYVLHFFARILFFGKCDQFFNYFPRLFHVNPPCHFLSVKKQDESRDVLDVLVVSDPLNSQAVSVELN